jgi:hypothetical protein
MSTLYRACGEGGGAGYSTCFLQQNGNRMPVGRKFFFLLARVLFLLCQSSGRLKETVYNRLHFAPLQIRSVLLLIFALSKQIKKQNLVKNCLKNTLFLL